jgi:hypothetical protein
METETDFGQMNRKQLMALLVLVVVLGGAAWLYSRKQSAGWSNQNPELGRKLLGNFQVNDVGQIHIQQGTNDLTLVRTNKLWRVVQRDDYPANFSLISQFLLKLRDLKIIQAEEVGKSQLPELDLASGQGSNAATLLEFCDASGQPIRKLWLGKQHLHQSGQPSPDAAADSWPDGRYVLTASNSTSVAVISDPLNEVTPTPDQWLDKSFLNIQKPQSISVNFPAATNSWTLARSSETNQWKLADAKPGEKLDESQASETANAFSSPSFDDVATGVTPKQTGLDKPTRIEIKTFGGFDYAVDVGHQTNDDYYLTVHASATLPRKPVPIKGEKAAQVAAADKAFQAKLKTAQDKLARESALNHWVYLVPTWSVNPLLKTREQLLLPKPKPEAEKNGSAAHPSVTKLKS